jgi:NAD(P)-dependent dehydrogenase (short-subunit alcohol dehydrogenase family)
MDMMIPSLKGKRVLVTGSSRGIGKALAEGFARCGADIAVHGSKISEKMDATVAELSCLGVKVAPVYGDLSDPNAAKSIMEQTLAALGGIDILVCNASVEIRRKWYDIPLEEMQYLTQVNFFSAIQLMQLA